MYFATVFLWFDSRKRKLDKVFFVILPQDICEKMKLILPEQTSPFQNLIAFHKVIESLEEVAKSNIDFQADYAQKLLAEVSKYPALTEGISDVEELEDYKPIIKILLADLFPQSLTHNEIKAVSIPFQLHTFNHTERFEKILDEAGEDYEFTLRDFTTDNFFILNCCVILKFFFGYKIEAVDAPFFLDIPNKEGVLFHYRALFNADFLEIIPTERSIMLSEDEIVQLIDNFDDIELWRSKFPEQSWLLKGFSIMTLFDATVENAVSTFKSNLLIDESFFQFSEIENIFRSIYKIPDLKIGFTVIGETRKAFELRIVEQQMYSHLLHNSTIEECESILCGETVKNIAKTQQHLVVPDIDTFAVDNPHKIKLIEKLKAQNVKSFIFVPLVDNDKFMGLLELSSSRVRELNSVNANRLGFVLPFIKEKVSHVFSETENQIEAVIQKEYTAIHPSVKWRFQEEALKYLNNKMLDREYLLKEILFENVYPLYGQIDVQGSSDSRNTAIQSDLIHQTKDLIALFETVAEVYHLPLFDQKIFDLNKHLHELQNTILTSTESAVNEYFTTEIHPILNNFRDNNSDENINAQIDQYFDKITLSNDEGYHGERVKFDQSIALINKKLARIIDEKQVEAQSYFPHYYERFKTDGIEHNMYIGASIVPDKQFEKYYLQNLRLWQMQVMCEMENHFYQIKSTLPHELEVSSLILVFGTPISIRFKMDEKQFDVDGSYNVRYEIAKKRIDKAHIKNSSERITQKGKLTIVYSQETEQKEYLDYIRLLQHKNLLDKEIERFDVEDLQGVVGLKALRVGFIYQ